MTAPELSSKLDLLRGNIEQLAAIPQSSYDDFAGDFRNLSAALHLPRRVTGRPGRRYLVQQSRIRPSHQRVFR